jgi:hypothetical protein
MQPSEKENKEKQRITKGNCKSCGVTITRLHRFEDLYCNVYCCNCCPDKKEELCEKERKFGSPLDLLKS